jgi:Zn-dependent protease with chaperone function
MIGLLEVAAMAGSMFALVTWGVVAFFAPGGSAPSRPSAPTRRAAVARAWLYAPAWVPALLLVSATVPGVLAALADRDDHCLTHGADHHHHHLCLLHPPHVADHMLAWALPVALLLPALGAFSLCARRTWGERRLARALVATSQPSGLGSNVRVLDLTEPVALTVGASRPVVLLSQGLIEQATPETLAVVLAHEQAHVDRRDGWLALLDRFAACTLPRAASAPLLDQVALAREQACDAAAAARVGSTEAVARALAEVVRLEMRAPAHGLSVAAGSVLARATHLLHPPPRDLRWAVTVVAVFAALIAAGSGPVHSGVEHLITSLLHR